MWQVFLWDGMVHLQSSVRFEHPVKFQGCGQLILDNQVVLGNSMANAGSVPILLQPRSADACIHIGENTWLSNGVEIIAQSSVTVGKDCLIGARTLILDSDFHGLSPDERRLAGAIKPVTIKDNVWIGSDVTLLKGVTIENDAVVGAGCIVTKDTPPGAIAVGNPMSIIGSAYAS